MFFEEVPLIPIQRGRKGMMITIIANCKLKAPFSDFAGTGGFFILRKVDDDENKSA
jgi:hypothetical protein